MFDSETFEALPYPIERRSVHRQRFLTGGKLLNTAHDSSVDCLIKNVSDGGAKIRTNPGVTIHSGSVLLFTVLGRAYGTTVIWTDACKAGVKFERIYDLGRASPDRSPQPRHRWLKKLLP
ncbi:MAG: PilZ domain-containing protein [Caulobacteraceae bacterium]